MFGNSHLNWMKCSLKYRICNFQRFINRFCVVVVSPMPVGHHPEEPILAKNLGLRLLKRFWPICYISAPLQTRYYFLHRFWKIKIFIWIFTLKSNLEPEDVIRPFLAWKFRFLSGFQTCNYCNNRNIRSLFWSVTIFLNFLHCHFVLSDPNDATKSSTKSSSDGKF